MKGRKGLLVLIFARRIDEKACIFNHEFLFKMDLASFLLNQNQAAILNIAQKKKYSECASSNFGLE